MDLPGFQELFRVGRDEILVRQRLLTAAAVEREGSDANIDVAAAAACADEVMSQLAQVAASVFLDSASGAALDRLVFDRYGLLRKPASAAMTSVQFRLPAPNPAAFQIPVGTLLQTADGVQFVTTVAELFPFNSAGPVTVAVRSTLAGAEQQVGPNVITNLISSIPNAPSSLALTVTNPFASAGADNEESDDSLRDRARRFFLTARRGTLAAIEAAALGVPGVRTAKALEVLDGLGRPARFVALVITDAYTDALADLSVTVPTYAAQSQVLTTAVFNALDDVRAAGMYVQVMVAKMVLQPVQLRLSFLAGANVDFVAIQARAAIVNYTNSLAPGQTWVRDDAQTALRSVAGLFYTGEEIDSPAGDVVCKPLQAIRTSLALVSAVSAQSDKTLLVTTNPDAFLLAGV